MARGERTQRVRELVEELGISERTAWRWLAHEPYLEPEDLLWRSCRGCRKPLPAKATIRRTYCSSRCRVYAHRRRKAAERIAKLRAADECRAHA